MPKKYWEECSIQKDHPNTQKQLIMALKSARSLKILHSMLLLMGQWSEKVTLKARFWGPAALLRTNLPLKTVVLPYENLPLRTYSPTVYKISSKEMHPYPMSAWFWKATVQSAAKMQPDYVQPAYERLCPEGELKSWIRSSNTFKKQSHSEDSLKAKEDIKCNVLTLFL